MSAETLECDPSAHGRVWMRDYSQRQTQPIEYDMEYDGDYWAEILRDQAEIVGPH